MTEANFQRPKFLEIDFETQTDRYGRFLAQPFERHHGRRWKWFSFGFNGNVANYAELKKILLDYGVP